MAAFVQSCPFWSSWLPSLLGLLGTGLLALSTWRAVQLAKKRNGVMLRLLDLEVDMATPPEAGVAGDAATKRRLAELDESQMALLKALKNDLDAADQRWTPSDTRRTYVGVVLTILSYAIPTVVYLPRLCGKG